MNRRQFLRLGFGAAGIALVGGGAWRFTKETLKMAEQISPDVDSVSGETLRSLASIVQDPSSTKIFGVDHEYMEPILYESLASYYMLQQMKEKKVTKIFIETSTAFDALFKQAPNMSADEFAVKVLESYPDHEAWAEKTPRAEQQLAYNRKLALHNLIVCCKAHGIQVVPYDRRCDGDLAKLEKQLNAYTDAVAVYEQRASIKDDTLTKKIATLAEITISGVEAVGETKAMQKFARIAELEQQDQEYMAADKVIEVAVSTDAANAKCILDQTKPDENIIVIAGNDHVEMKNGLRALIEESKRTVTSAYYFVQSFPQEAEAYVRHFNSSKRKLADYILVSTTGKLVKTADVPATKPRPRFSAMLQALRR